MQFLFEVVIPLKPTLLVFIFIDINLLKWRVCIFLKTVSINCIFTLPVYFLTNGFLFHSLEL